MKPKLLFSNRRNCFLGLLVTLLLSLLVASKLSALSVVKIELVSVDFNGGDPYGSSSNPSISADGRYVAFESYASDLVVGDTNGNPDIFIYDRLTATTQRVSVDANGADSNGWSNDPSISADGRYVAFSSTASNLVAGDTNGKRDIFIYDRLTATTQRVSVDTNGADPDGQSDYLNISADGRYVAFSSTASNLVADDTNGKWDIFIYDRQTANTERVSVDTNGADSNGSSYYSSISADGRYVAFDSEASNLVVDDTNGIVQDIFVYDRHTATTERVSIDTNGGDPNGGSSNPSISADGRFVTFASSASDLIDDDTSEHWNSDIFVYDRLTATTQRVSVDVNGGDPNRGSGNPKISADGRYVTFDSFASNLIVGDINNDFDVFVYDRHTATTERVSVDTNGGDPNGESTLPSISADGRFVAFESGASDIFVGANGYNVFVAELNLSDSPPTTPTPTVTLEPTQTPTEQPVTSSIIVKNLIFKQTVLSDGSTQKLPTLMQSGLPQIPYTYDGNQLKGKAKLKNTGDTNMNVTFTIKETDSGTILHGPASYTVPAGGTKNVPFTWDTMGYAWDYNVDVHAPNQANSDRNIQIMIESNGQVIATKDYPVWIKPRPVMLVHGWTSHAGTWVDNGYVNYDTPLNPTWEFFAVDNLQTGYGGDDAVPATPFKGPEDNAKYLNDYIQLKRRQLNAHHVDIVAHSYGGIISRHYIHNDKLMQILPDGRPTVISLITLGTPHLGSPCAAADLRPGAITFDPVIMDRFNDANNRKRGVYFYALGGTGLSTCLSAIAASQTDIEIDVILKNSDSVVPFNSAIAGSDDWEEYYKAYHSDTIKTTGSNYLRDEYGFDTYVKPWLILSRPEFDFRQITISELFNSQPIFTTNNDIPSSAFGEITLTDAQKQTILFDVNTDQYMNIQYDIPHGVGAKLTDPDGAILRDVTVDQGLDWSGFNLGIEKPIPGRYELELSSVNSQTQSINYVMIESDVPIRVNLNRNSLSPLRNQSAPIQIQFTENDQPLTGLNPEITLKNVDNDEIQTAIAVETDISGVYESILDVHIASTYRMTIYFEVSGEDYWYSDVLVPQGVELLNNSGFEIDGDRKKDAFMWKGKNLSRDKRKCNKDIDGDGITDKVVAYSGECMWQFKGFAGINGKLIQNADDALVAPGDSLALSVWIQSRNLTAGGKIKAIVKYIDGSKSKALIAPENGSNDYQPYIDYLDVTQNVKKVKVIAQMRSNSGKMRVDDLSLLKLDDASALRDVRVPLPTHSAPENFRGTN